ncbi:hypothetical protein [Pseudomonas sp. R2-60-08W]|uniref:hypothetical protein n=1 Tax=Pseudomonas sp. R2-60-08W TaxID=1173280 RepID=UPI000F586D3F|nr:hypothetical protein [Pseudomonas sp. R2-60-08W]AZF29278.1 hypothetical protein C4J90_5153 [Pseudomonas sp. R2-60-08W]
MADLSDSDKNGSSDAAAIEEIEIKIHPDNLTGITMVTGAYPLHGYKGFIEVEHTWRNNTYMIHALRYQFERGAVTGKNPRFEISAMAVNGPTLTVVPPQDGQWHFWGSSTSYRTANTAMDFKFYFVFDAPEGVWRTDTKILRLIAN